MHELTPFERRLSDRLAVEMSGSVRPFDAQAIADAAMRGRRSWSPRTRLVLLAATTALLLATTIAVGTGIVRLPPFLQPPVPWPLAGVLEPAGSLEIASQTPVAVLLQDGRVLVLSSDINKNESGAQLWNPATGTFEVVGPMTRYRGETPGAVVLLDGRVLVFGGGGAEGTAETFNPTTRTFSALASGPATIDGSTILLRDGRVLISGGAQRQEFDESGRRGTAVRAEIFDPATNVFLPVGDMQRARIGHELHMLGDGRVLVLGGLVDELQAVVQPSAEIFDPSTTTFELTERPPMRTQFAEPWTHLSDRLVFMQQPGLGQYPDRSLPMSVTFYDLSTGAWTDGPSIPASAPVYDVQTLVALTESRLLIVGFHKASFEVGPAGILDRGWIGILDLESGLLHELAVRESSWGTAVQLRDGRVLLAGGVIRGECVLPEVGAVPCTKSSAAADLIR